MPVRYLPYCYTRHEMRFKRMLKLNRGNRLNHRRTKPFARYEQMCARIRWA